MPSEVVAGDLERSQNPAHQLNNLEPGSVVGDGRDSGWCRSEACRGSLGQFVLVVGGVGPEELQQLADVQIEQCQE